MALITIYGIMTIVLEIPKKCRIVFLRANSLTFLSHSFPICKIEIILFATMRVSES